MSRLGVIGWPVAHSRSPAMHNAALARLGMDGWRYQLLPVPPELFEQTTPALADAGFLGVNVTIPHKRAALKLSTSTSEAAAQIGAANTLTFGEDGEIAAENTDAPGLLDALGVPVAGMRALVLGAGGSARAAVWALREAGAAEVAVWNRTAERAQELARALGATAIPHPMPADLLVNCTSVGDSYLRPVGMVSSTNWRSRSMRSLSTRMSSTWPTAQAKPRCSLPRAPTACTAWTVSRCCSRRARAASSCGRAGRRRSRSCAQRRGRADSTTGAQRPESHAHDRLGALAR